MLDSFAIKSLSFSQLWVVCLTPLMYMPACTIFLTGKDIHVYTHTYIHIYIHIHEMIYTDINEQNIYRYISIYTLYNLNV